MSSDCVFYYFGMFKKKNTKKKDLDEAMAKKRHKFAIHSSDKHGGVNLQKVAFSLISGIVTIILSFLNYYFRMELKCVFFASIFLNKILMKLISGLVA